MCLQKFPPSLQNFWNLPLANHLSYLHVLTRNPPWVCRFSEICHWTDTYICLQKFPPFADFPKSATVHLPKLLICAFRNSHSVCRFSEICHWTVTLVTFLKSSNGQLCKLPICACRNSPSLQIFWNLPLDSNLSYLHVLAEIPTPSLQIFCNLPLDSYLSFLHVLSEIPPPSWRFSEICHWTVT